MPATVIPVKGIQPGFIGSICSEGLSLRSPRPVQSTDANPIAFGETLVVNANNTYSSMKTFIANGGTPTAATPMALAPSNVKTNTNFANGQNVTGGSYAPGDICDALVEGSLFVYCANGTPTAGGTVYLRKTYNAAIPNGVVGGLEAAADGTNSIALNPLYVAWKSNLLGADGTAQITIINRMIP
jgi:hypothetical protein